MELIEGLLTVHRISASRMCLPALAMIVMCAFTSAQELPCKNAMVKYERESHELQERVKLRAAGDREHDTAKRNVSVQGTRWFTMKTTPDYTKPGPWSTAIVVGNRSDGRPFLRIDVFDHGNTLNPKWLNEKLIYIEVWWGRISASDLIVDVEKKQIIYDESAHYGELTFCKE